MQIKDETGKLGENLAANYLKKKKYKILQRNFKERYGEIDIIAIDGSKKEKVLVFVEVKTRKSNEFGKATESITFWKIKSLIKTANYYKLINKNLPELMRIDAVCIDLDYSNKVQNIEHLENISF